MTKYKITFDRSACIGAASCTTAAPDFWPISDDGKPHIPKAKISKGGDLEEIIIEEKDLEQNLDALRVCPVTVIKITNLETGKELN